jgi:hypothetical protein
MTICIRPPSKFQCGVLNATEYKINITHQGVLHSAHILLAQIRATIYGKHKKQI